MVEVSVPVLIVGGGVVGLSASLFFAEQGVSTMLCEKHPTTCVHPRARGVNGRTMELMRALGLEDRIRKAGERLGPSVGIYRGKTLVEVLDKQGGGSFFMRAIRARGIKGQPTSKSPTGACRCTQDDLEPILLEAARERSVDARFSHEVVDLEQNADEVIATVRDRVAREDLRVRARYVVSADGARSPIRQRLGIARSDSGAMGHQLNVLFRADLTELVKGREFSMCLIEGSGFRGLLASIDNHQVWVLHVAYQPDRGERPEDFPPSRCAEIIKKAIGIDDLAVEVVGVLPWESAVRIAETYRSGRVFLAGDAAHAMPPWGGFGANTGIQDAHNLAWKIALVMRGQAGAGLLDTYESERRPVARAVGEIAGTMNDERGLMAMRGRLTTLWAMRKIWPYLTMGYGYASPGVCLERGAPPGPGSTDLRGRPGTRAPHVWIERGGAPISTLDLFGSGFVLLGGDEAERWCAAAVKISRRLDVLVSAHRLGRDLEGNERRFRRAFGLKRDGAALVRPDGIVAWRAKAMVDDPERALEKAMRQLLFTGDPTRDSLEPARP